MDCFRKHNIERTLVAMSTHFIQQVCGVSWVVGQAPPPPLPPTFER